MRSCGVGVFCRFYSAVGVSQAVYSLQQELFQQLTVLRERVGKVQEKPPKIILNDKDIQNIVDALPHTLTDLKKIKNIGDQKVKLVGKDVISLIKNLQTKLNKQQRYSRTKIIPQTQSSTVQQQNLEFKPQNYETQQFISPKNSVQDDSTDEISDPKVDNKANKSQLGVMDFQPEKNLNTPQNLQTSSIGDTGDNQESKNIVKQEIDIDDKKSCSDKLNEISFESIQSGQNIGDETKLSKQNLRQSISGQSNSQIKTNLNKINSENIEADKTNEQQYFSPRIEFQNGDVVFAKKKSQSGSFLSSVWSNIDQMVKKVTG